MEHFVLYCKSFDRDVLRVNRLVASIERFNVEKIRFYVSVPEADRNLFHKQIGTGRCEWISDEEIAAANPAVKVERMYGIPGNVVQQIIKSEFWRLGLAENYLCLDSDLKFIREFRRSDFLAPDGNPYTVIHQAKELLQAAANSGKRKVVAEFYEESQRAKSIFGRSGPDYDFGPAPMIWSKRVWQDLAEKYLAPQGITIWEAIQKHPAEIRWYGEALLHFASIPLYPIEPLFRIYHYDWQYFQARRAGESEEKLKANYLGVGYQSNWQYELDYGKPQKSWASRVARSIRRQLHRFV